MRYDIVRSGLYCFVSFKRDNLACGMSFSKSRSSVDTLQSGVAPTNTRRFTLVGEVQVPYPIEIRAGL